MKKILSVIILILLLAACKNDPNVYTVTFEGEGTTTISPIEITEGHLITGITITDREGYTFDGWYTSDETLWNMDTDKVTQDMTLTASWSINAYTITFLDEDSTVYQELSLDYLSTISFPTLDVDGFIFVGWSETDQSDDVTDITTVPAYSVTFYPIFEAEPMPEYQIALITDSGDIDDHGYNEMAYMGVVSYAEYSGLTYAYYKPDTMSYLDMMASVVEAVIMGAEVVVLPGFLFEQVVYDAQSIFTDVNFILLDGSPHNENFSDFTIEDNTVAINYYSHELGFLAGYQAYQMGYVRTAIFGGMRVPEVLRYGVGFVAGFYYAANEDGYDGFTYNANDIYFAGSFAPSNELVAEATTYYNNGVDAIFSVSGGGILSIIAAAESLQDKMVIGSESDLSTLSDRIAFSAIKNLTVSTFVLLDTYYSDTFPGGNQITHGIDQLAIDLAFPIDFSDDLTPLITLYAEMVLGNIPIPSDAHELMLFITDYLSFNEPTGLEQALSLYYAN